MVWQAQSSSAFRVWDLLCVALYLLRMWCLVSTKAVTGTRPVTMRANDLAHDQTTPGAKLRGS